MTVSSEKKKAFKTTSTQPSTVSSLTASALKNHNANDEKVGNFWETQKSERIERLVKASRELGFQLPHSCY